MKYLVLLLAALSAVSAAPQDASFVTLRNVLTSNNFTRLVDDLVKFDLADIVSKAGPKTIFAPSNEAYRTLMMENRQAANNTDTMKNLLRRSFVVNRKIVPADITNEMVVDTINGEKLRFNIYNQVIYVNGVALPKEPVVTGDTVIYRINLVIMSSFKAGQDLMTVLDDNKDRFSTLSGAIRAAGLADTLKTDPGPFTLFAPTNDAFRNLPPDTLTRLTGSPSEMKKVLLGHLAKGTFFLDVLDDTNNVISTMDGASNKIVVSGSRITVDSAPVVTSADKIMGTNGVIHAISRVLMP